MLHNWQCKRCTHEWMTSCMGDPPGKVRYEALFGLDMSTGNIVAPFIRANDGTNRD